MKTQKIIPFLLLFVGSFLIQSCSKDDPGRPEEELPDLPPATVTKSGEYTVTELPGDLTVSMGGQDGTGDGGFKPVYYSLEDGRVVPEAYVKSDHWDIAFTGIYNSSIWANNGAAEYNPAKGGIGSGGAYLVVDPVIDAKYYDAVKHQPKQVPIDKSLLDEAYSNVQSVPVADPQLMTNGYLSLDYFLGSSNGYAFYDFYGAMFPGNKERGHIVYNLPRPIIIKTAKGNYAKLIIYSFYKGSPRSPTLADKAPYISFKYTILKDGSKDFTKITDN